MRNAAFILGIGLTLLLAQSSAADVVAREDFDGGAVNLSSTTNVFNFPGLGGDFSSVFGRVAFGSMPREVADDSVFNVSGLGPIPGDTLGIAGGATTAFFAMNEMDGASLPGNMFAIWSFDISGALPLSGIHMDMGAMGDFETSETDGFRVEAQIDGGGYSTIFLTRTNESASHTYRAFDGGFVGTLDDPLELFIDGSVLASGFLDKQDANTGLFDTYTSVLFAGQSGSNLDIRVSWEGGPKGFQEPMGIDNIIITSVPEPSVYGLLAVLALGAAIHRRRKYARSSNAM